MTGEIVRDDIPRHMGPVLLKAAGSEVDVVIDTQSGLIPIEIKRVATPRPEMARGIISFQDDLKEKALPGYVIHTGAVTLPLGSGVTALPLDRL